MYATIDTNGIVYLGNSETNAMLHRTPMGRVVTVATLLELSDKLAEFRSDLKWAQENPPECVAQSVDEVNEKEQEDMKRAEQALEEVIRNGQQALETAREVGKQGLRHVGKGLSTIGGFLSSIGDKKEPQE